jgi:hypothetical protein
MRACEDLQKRNIPNSSPLVTLFPSLMFSFKTHINISVIPVATKHIKPILGFSDSMKINMQVVNEVVKASDRMKGLVAKSGPGVGGDEP